MELNSDFRSELVDEPSSHVSKTGTAGCPKLSPPACCFGPGIPEGFLQLLSGLLRPELACWARV